MNEQNVIITIWCVVSDQQGRVLLVNNNEEKVKPWHLPSGIFSPKNDDSTNCAVRRIMRESVGVGSVLFRQLETKVIKKSENRFELQMWYLCIPCEEMEKKSISWEKLDKLVSSSFLPHGVIKALAKIG